MGEWKTVAAEFRAPRSDVAVLLATFLITVLVDLVVAIEIGMVMAAFLFMKRMSEVTNVSVVTRELADGEDDYESDPNALRRRDVPPGVASSRSTGRSSSAPPRRSATRWVRRSSIRAS
jgi:SulP family sulfate permease